jgi:cation:H+ antiporter
MINLVLFIIGFIILIKGADWLVRGASAIARRFQVSDLVIGLTVVAFGTSTPELFVNIVASLKGSTGIAVGNVLGSNIANILLILGISSMIYPLSVSRGTVWKEIPFSLLAVLTLGLMVNDQIINADNASLLSRSDGLVLLCFFIIFLYYSYGIANDIEGMSEQLPVRSDSLAKSLVLVLLGIAGLAAGGKWIVDGAILLSTMLGMDESLIGLTIVALGTSLPELATSAVAAYRRNVEIAVGNVVGSNIFNVYFVLGVSASIKPLPFESTGNRDVVVVIVASIMLFLFMFTGKKQSLDRWEGLLFVCGYAVYLFSLIR